MDSLLLGGDVKEFLERAHLSQYATAIIDEHGYDSMDLINGLDDSQLDALVDVVGMKVGHKIKFKKLIAPTPVPVGTEVVAAEALSTGGGTSTNTRLSAPSITNQVMDRSAAEVAFMLGAVAAAAATETDEPSTRRAQAGRAGQGGLLDRIRSDPYRAQFPINISAARDECCGECCPCFASAGGLPPYDANDWRGRLSAAEYRALAGKVDQMYSDHKCSRGACCCCCCCGPSSLETYLDQVSEELRPRGVSIKIATRHVTRTNGIPSEDAFRLVVSIWPI